MGDLGRKLLHDPRSRNFAYPHTAPTEGRSVRHRLDAKNLDQFYTAGCVGFAGTNLLNTAPAMRLRQRWSNSVRSRNSIRYLTGDDALHNYSESTRRDPFDWTYPPTDEGSSALGLMKYWQSVGVISRYQWTFDFQSFLAALQRQPVLVGTAWYDSMSVPNPEGLIRPSGKGIGGHEYLATGILWRDKLIRFENSWGEGWGDKGGFYMSWHSTENLIADGGDVAVPIL